MKTSQNKGLLKDDFLYTTSNGTLNKINIKTGEVLYAIFLIDFFIHNNYNINGGIRSLVWYDDAIWTIMRTVPEVLLKINPSDGKIEEVISLEEYGIKSTALEIKFYEHKLYILDIDSTLHILDIDKSVVF